MTRFLDVRTWKVGGPLAHRVAVFEGTSIDDYTGYDETRLIQEISGQNVLLVTHGFNVNRQDGIACLSNWESLLLQLLPPGWLYIGILWPGDSIWLHGLDYPEEPKLADHAGKLLGPWLDKRLVSAATVNFASHSLGGRLILQIARNMQRSANRAILMAGAINDDCLSNEFAPEANRIASVSVLASRSDDVLKLAFPLGNLAGGILDEGHPWLQSALGRSGPAPIGSAPSSFLGPWQIPDGWGYGHHHYLQVDPCAAVAIPTPFDPPPQGAGKPLDGVDGWQQKFSAAFAATRLLR
jgi:hypothetical protein